ncbi:translation initiation factor IF-2-like [Perognathus longimembris pacificus]|uniref:translation initiation factor IF-2-like n=1 Tax=Perognathus longimembris pacificus TaxID=214514 RepID=UPI002019BA81|nr:translation initiation factor IF-2-like [Perognathus longimembris pacificus]
MPIGDSLQEQPGVLGGPQVRVLHQAEEQQMAAAIQLCLGQRRAEELSHARMQEQDAGGASSGPSSSRRARPLRLRAPPGGATGLPGAAEQVTGAEVTSAHPPESPAFPRLLRPTTPALGFLGEKPQAAGDPGAPHPPAAAAAGPPSPPSPPPACGSVACGALCPCEHAHPGLPFCSTLTSSSRSGVQELPAAAARVQVRTPLELGHPHPCICDWLREGAAGAGRRCSISRGAETLHSRRPPARPPARDRRSLGKLTGSGGGVPAGQMAVGFLPHILKTEALSTLPRFSSWEPESPGPAGGRQQQSRPLVRSAVAACVPCPWLLEDAECPSRAAAPSADVLKPV